MEAHSPLCHRLWPSALLDDSLNMRKQSLHSSDWCTSGESIRKLAYHWNICFAIIRKTVYTSFVKSILRPGPIFACSNALLGTIAAGTPERVLGMDLRLMRFTHTQSIQRRYSVQ